MLELITKIKRNLMLYIYNSVSCDSTDEEILADADRLLDILSGVDDIERKTSLSAICYQMKVGILHICNPGGDDEDIDKVESIQDVLQILKDLRTCDEMICNLNGVVRHYYRGLICESGVQRCIREITRDYTGVEKDMAISQITWQAVWDLLHQEEEEEILEIDPVDWDNPEEYE